jgi:hypothetical protein
VGTCLPTRIDQDAKAVVVNMGDVKGTIKDASDSNSTSIPTTMNATMVMKLIYKALAIIITLVRDELIPHIVN